MKWLPPAVSVVAAMLAIGAIDYLTGVELRVFPLYYLPVTLAAWRGGRRGASAAALLATLSWLVANNLAGLTYSRALIWVGNTVVQGTSFLVVGLLIAKLHHALERERELSRTDALTGLLNSRAFYEEAELMLALCRRARRPITLAYVDLDNFKQVNDTGGHQAGDALLQRIADVLRSCTRTTDLACRLGGDEFALLLPETDAEGGRVMLDRLRRQIAEAAAKNAPQVSGSIGAVTHQVAPATVEALVHGADERMYAAKAAGKNQVVLDVVADVIAPPGSLPIGSPIAPLFPPRSPS